MDGLKATLLSLFRDMPVRRKMVWVVMLASAASLLIAISATALYESTSFRPRVLRDLRAVAALYTLTMPAPLRFNDSKAATENIATLKIHPEIGVACVYDAHGILFAQYIRSPDRKSPCVHSSPFIDQYRFDQGHLDLLQPIHSDGAILGSLFFRYDLPSFFARLPQYWIVVAMIVISLASVSVLSVGAFQIGIAPGILHLQRTAQLISEEKNYHLRASKWGRDEVGVMTDAFNHMLDTIEQNQLALTSSQRRLQDVMDNSPALICLKDTEFRYVMINLKFSELFGISSNHAAGMTDYSIFPKASADVMRSNDLKVLGADRPMELEETLPVGTESRTYLSIKFPLREPSGNVYGICGISTDITERKHAEKERVELIQQMREAIQLRDEFLSIASHELNTPVTPLKIQIQTLRRLLEKESLPKFRPIAALLGESEKQMDRLLRLINDLLDVSRIRTGQMMLQPVEFDLSELFNDVLRRHRPELQAARNNVTTSDETPVIVKWDKPRIEQVIVNLLTNAIKYGAGKPIEISWARVGENARISVRDHGIGIAPEDQERIFNRFERAVSSKSFGGLGLGLYITRQIIQAHQGTISVSSKLGDGSEFIMEIPLQIPPASRKDERT